MGDIFILVLICAMLAYTFYDDLLPEGSLNKSLHALAKSFPAMLCQMSLNVAMLRFRATKHATGMFRLA